MLCGHLYLNLIIVIARKTSFFPLNAMVGKLNMGVIFVFLRSSWLSSNSSFAMKDTEVTLNNYFRSFSVGYSLFPTVRERHFPCFTPH